MTGILESFSHRNKTLQVVLQGSFEVFPGVICDVYIHPETKERDLGVITIKQGAKTFPQKVQRGIETIEGYMSGRGKLIIVKPSGDKLVFNVGPEDEGFSHTVEIGDTMQWQASKDEDLMVFEICYPPYDDGRFENLEYRNLLNDEASESVDRIILRSSNDTVSLKQLVPEDARLYFDLVNFDRSHLSQHGDNTAQKYPTAKTVKDSIENPANMGKYRFGIWDGERMVGSNNLTLMGNNTAELGSWVGKEYIGNNYAARARKLLVDFAFNHLGLREVFCEIVVGNTPSKKSVEKSGFAYAGERDGKWIYVLKRDS